MWEDMSNNFPKTWSVSSFFKLFVVNLWKKNISLKILKIIPSENGTNTDRISSR